MKRSQLITCILFLTWLISMPKIASAQLDNEYFIADQLFRQQKYEQAYEKFYKLHQQHLATYIYFEKTIETLIKLKRYDQAISIAQKSASMGHFRARANVKLGAVYHISGDKKQAFNIWQQVHINHDKDRQVNLLLARTMAKRQEFEKAIEIYGNLRQQFANSNMISSELANIYLQAGKYEKAIREYLQLVKKMPERMSYVQQRLIRFQDDYIYDVAILEISDFLDELSPDHPSYRSLQQLEVWLLIERELYERALVTAKHYESESSNLTYILYNVGRKLLAAQKFELAKKAYSYYVEQEVHSLKYRSMEKIAEIYQQWATYLENYNLGLSSKKDALYQQAFTSLQSIWDQKPNYRRIDKVLVSLAELSLDIYHQPQTAQKYVTALRQLSDRSLSPQIHYIEGRLHLYKNDYTRARIAFTKSNKQANTGNLAEETRYYLALTDFYDGDFEFAKIQLNALERQNTSYFANDAVKLRLLIQNGLQADSSAKQLTHFAQASEYFSQGKDELARNKLHDLFEAGSYHPLFDDAILELSTHKTEENIGFIYTTLSQYLDQNAVASPLYERLLWERARLADQFVTNKEINFSITKSTTDSLSSGEKIFRGKQVQAPTTIDQLVPIYEEILVHFPNGFYATYVRNRINELQNIQT